ncbi:MAG TPA: VWA domain-containing protein [Candidatus Binataceae bacterium]|jgi:Mg-chelatase subunit ChlD|nr:VWA domain-containing protein [Candidatus Binataceae bacterium]
MFERPDLLWLLLAAPLVVAPGLMAVRAGRRAAGAGAAALRLSLFVILVALLAGLRLPLKTPAQRMAVVVAMDASHSIAPDQFQWMRRQMEALRAAMDPRDRMAVLEFGRSTRLLAPLGDPRLVHVDPSRSGADPGGTDVAGGLTTALSLLPPQDEKRIVLLSDGNETDGNAASELPALVEQGVRLYAAAPPPSSAGRVAIVDFQAPTPVRAHASFALRLDVLSEADRPAVARVRLTSNGQELGHRSVVLQPGLNRFALPYQIDRYGAYLLNAQIEVNSPLVTVNAGAETAVSVIGPPRVLVVSTNPPDSLLSALRLRQYEVEETPPHGLPANPEAYLAYQAVILVDVTAAALAHDVQAALARYVGDYGGGLIVTGDALRDEKFHQGELEKALPITFTPQPPPPSREPIAVYLLIDRSNSMSYNSRYPAVRDGERIRYAKEAAGALLNQLDDTDYAGVIAFDSEPYVLSHLRPVGEDRAELSRRIERLEPGGGTDFKESLEIAEREILASGIPVHQVILLTDGDTNRQYHDHDQLMADYDKQHISVSTIRIGPDLENLRLLQDFAKVTGGTFYRVEDIRKLPLLLVRLTHQAIADKRHQQSHLEYAGESTILSGISPREIPPIGLFATTVPKDGAAVPLRIRRNDTASPLLAAWQYGLGRSAVFAADTDSTASLSWVRWNRYAEFWSQLASWVMRQGDSGPFSLRVHNAAGGVLNLQAEKADNGPVNNLVCRITGAGTAMDVPMTESGRAVYTAESAPLRRGKYNVTLMVKDGDTERVLVRREVAVPEAGPADQAEFRLRPANLDLLRQLARATGGAVAAPPAQILGHRGELVTVYRDANPYLLPLVIVLILGEVFMRRRFLGD